MELELLSETQEKAIATERRAKYSDPEFKQESGWSIIENQLGPVSSPCCCECSFNPDGVE